MVRCFLIPLQPCMPIGSEPKISFIHLLIYFSSFCLISIDLQCKKKKLNKTQYRLFNGEMLFNTPSTLHANWFRYLFPWFLLKPRVKAKWPQLGHICPWEFETDPTLRSSPIYYTFPQKKLYFPSIYWKYNVRVVLRMSDIVRHKKC